MIVYYENMNGEKLNLLKAPFRTTKTDWFNADWSESSEGYEKTVTVDVFGKREEFRQNMEQLYRILAVDAETNSYGKLYVNGAYLRCRVLKSVKEGWKGYVYSEVELTFEAPELVWVTETTMQFFPQSSEPKTSGIDYPYDYPFEYARGDDGTTTWYVDHIIPSEYQMLIYGPCTNPKITINKYPYEFNVSLGENEYLVVDSQARIVRKYLQNGTTENVFEQRAFEHTVFEKIPSGMLDINWSGTYGFDLTLYLNRREPPW